MTQAEIQEAVAGHHARNMELLRQLQEREVSFDEWRTIEHHFWAPSHREAALLARALYSKGHLVITICPTDMHDGTKCWNVETERQESVLQATRGDVIEEFVRMADSLNAVYDGWGTSI